LNLNSDDVDDVSCIFSLAGVITIDQISQLWRWCI